MSTFAALTACCVLSSPLQTSTRDAFPDTQALEAARTLLRTVRFREQYREGGAALVASLVNHAESLIDEHESSADKRAEAAAAWRILEGDLREHHIAHSIMLATANWN